MGKYRVRMKCGHEEWVELFGRDVDRRKKIEYFESSRLCKECYRNMIQKEEKSVRLLFNIAALSYIDNTDGEILFFAWFSGDTFPHKDDIKKIGGYRWEEMQSVDPDNLSNRMCWNKIIKNSDIEKEIKKAQSIGATVNVDNLFSSKNYEIATIIRNNWLNNNDYVKSEEGGKV